MPQLKPALTYDQQIDRLKNVHNLSIVDDAAALEILKKVNYYRLSAYGLGLSKKEDKEKYIDGISLEHIYRLYEFDSIFRNMLIHVIEQLEIQLRTQISNFLALTYGSEGYVDPAHFTDKKTKTGESVHATVMESFNKERDHQKNAPFVKHHMDKYEGHFPVWVAIELFTFGNLSSLYSIMVLDDRKEIARLYNTEPKYLGSWILALVEIRNICAHYSRLYNMPLKQTPHLYPEYQKYRVGTLNKVFPALLCIKRMLNSDERWCSFETQLEALIDEYSDVVRLSFMGFPKEWKEILSKK
ncbi:MAG: Abi family protein [Eubacteriales bacterium]|nr:Abi family protein [Eubacteriales bacterium]